MPRVVAGTSRGIPLIAPKGQNTRPTTDKVKEALFSILQNRLPDAAFLDLFAGCGQMGIEAISRGAKEAVLVDENNRCGDAIVQNIAKTKTDGQIRYIKNDVCKAIQILAGHKETFDIIYMDPPYTAAIPFSEKIAGLICSGKLLRNNGLFIVEHSSLDLLKKNVTNLTFTRRCKYGSTMLTFYTTDDCY